MFTAIIEFNEETIAKLAQEIAKILKPELQPQPIPLLSYNELCAQLGLSKATIWRKVQNGELPQPIKSLSGKRYWKRADIIRALKLKSDK